MIKRRNSLVKQSESIFQTNMGNVFCILWNLLRICVIWFIMFYKLTHARKICERYFTAINKECFKWDCNPFQKQPPKVFHKNVVHKNFAIFTGKHLCSLESLFNKVPGLKPRNFIQNRLQHRFFLWILQNFKEHLFWRTSANRYFSLFLVNSLKHLKKPTLKPKWQNKFENTLHAAQVMKRNH